MKSTCTRLGLAATVALLACSFSYADNVVSQFSLSTNTATNLWSYWGSTSTDLSTYPSTISLLPVLFPGSCGFGTTCWDASGGIDNLVLVNTTGSPASFGSATSPNNEVSFYTRNGLTLVRYLVPTAGSYSITGFFEGITVSPTSSTDAVALNGTLIGSSPELAFGATNPFSFVQTLAAGNTIDFLVAGNQAGIDSNSMATGFDVTITSGAVTAPEPASIILLGTGLLTVGLARRRRTVKNLL